MAHDGYTARIRKLLDLEHATRQRAPKKLLRFRSMAKVSHEGNRPASVHIEQLKALGQEVSRAGLSLSDVARRSARNAGDASILNAAWDGIAGWNS